MLGDYTVSLNNEYLNNLQVSKNYVYNPQVASDELGLPVDLIEEFIGDFIQQSYDFKEELYNHLAANELSELKLLSHKLKGVAANLRIEDAFEVLSIINTSSNVDEIRATLDHFYNIIIKLEGKEPQTIPSEETAPTALKNLIENDIFPLKDLDEEKEESKAEDSIVTLPIKTIDDDIYDIDLKFDEDEPLLKEDSPRKIDQNSSTEAAKELYDISEKLKVPVEIIEPLEYNKSSAINELGLPIDLVEELLGDFKEEVQNRIKELEIAVETNDNISLYDIVMSIKGTADNLRVTKISKVLEDLLSVNDLQKAKDLLIRLKNYINQL